MQDIIQKQCKVKTIIKTKIKSAYKNKMITANCCDHNNKKARPRACKRTISAPNLMPNYRFMPAKERTATTTTTIYVYENEATQ